MKICGCLTEKTSEKCIDTASKVDVDLIEHRMDFMTEIKGLKEIYSSIALPVIATNRPTWCGGMFNGKENERIKYLIDAIDAGCNLIDMEIETPMDVKRYLIDKVRRQDCKVIISMHDFEKTPSTNKLTDVLKKEKEQGADIGKIVTSARSIKDCHTVLGLMLRANNMNFSLVSFAMGALGKFTRVIAPLYGAPFTYASINEKAENSQLDVSSMREMCRRLSL